MKASEILNALDPIRWAMLAGAVALLIVAVLTLSYCSERERAGRAKHETKVATTQADVGHDANARAFQQQQSEADGAARTQANADNIMKAENADHSAGEAGRRGQLAYCERQRVRGGVLPEYCPRL